MRHASDPTFDLLLATIRPPADPRRRNVVARCAAAPVNWDRFLALANRHRVGPLVVEALTDADIALPPALATSLAEVGRRALFAEMALASEVERVVALLAAAGIDAILLKGPGLSLRAFGRLGLRTYRDLDLLVDERDVSAAEDVLVQAGYARSEPGADAGDLAAWRRDHKDAVFRHHGSDILIELHWRLFDNRRLMRPPLFAGAVPLGIAPLDGIRVLPAGVEFRYLCLHGALHAWARLRWLADVNALVAQMSPEFLLETARATGGRIGPAVAQTLILCRDLLGAVLPPKVETILARARRGRGLAWLARREIMRSGSRELEAVPFGSTIKNLSHYAMIEGPGALIEELRFDLAANPRAR